VKEITGQINSYLRILYLADTQYVTRVTDLFLIGLPVIGNHILPER
jgi:hypothetical protein